MIKYLLSLPLIDFTSDVNMVFAHLSKKQFTHQSHEEKLNISPHRLYFRQRDTFRAFFLRYFEKKI